MSKSLSLNLSLSLSLSQWCGCPLNVTFYTSYTFAWRDTCKCIPPVRTKLLRLKKKNKKITKITTTIKGKRREILTAV